jgi:hypothetical protein
VASHSVPLPWAAEGAAPARGVKKVMARPRRCAWPALLCLLALVALDTADGQAPACDAACKEAQRAALMRLHDALGGAAWQRRTGWGGPGDACTWAGVSCCMPPGAPPPAAPACGPVGAVAALDLSLNGVAGPLPPDALGPLAASLEALILSGNQVAGPLPAALGRLAKLRLLLVEGNNLTGPLPPELGALPQLSQFDFSDNAVTGAAGRGGARRKGSVAEGGRCTHGGSSCRGGEGGRAPGAEKTLHSPHTPRTPSAPPCQAPYPTRSRPAPRCVCCAALATACPASPTRCWAWPRLKCWT